MIDFIVRLSVFIICAQLIADLSPKKEYRKYIKILVNIMILAQSVGIVTKISSLSDTTVIENYMDELFSMDQSFWGMDSIEEKMNDIVEKNALEELSQNVGSDE